MPENVLNPPEHPEYDIEGTHYRLRRPQFRRDLLIGERDAPDGDSDEFKPALTFRFHEGLCRFKLKYMDAGHTNRNVDAIQPRPRRNAIRWRADDPDGVPVAVRFWDQPDDDDFGDSFEFDFTIGSLPPPGPRQNIFRFRLTTVNCTFEYQDPAVLPDPQVDPDAYTGNPRLTIGSYAVYASGVRVPGTGKLGHLYTAFARSADDAGGTYAQSVQAGTGRWCTFNADAQSAGFLDITIPKPWFQAAAFPVRIDPTIGYTTWGALGHLVTDLSNYVDWAYSGSVSLDDVFRRVWLAARTVTGSATALVGAYYYSGTLATSTLVSGSYPGTPITLASDNPSIWHSAQVNGVATAVSHVSAGISSNATGNTRWQSDQVTSGNIKSNVEASLAFPANLTGYTDDIWRHSHFLEVYDPTQNRLYPNAAGDATALTAVGGSTTIANVKSNPYDVSDDTGRYNQNLTAGDATPQLYQDLFNCDTFTIPTGFKVTAVKVFCRANHVVSGLVTSTIIPQIKTNGTVYNGSSAQSLTATISEYHSGTTWGSTNPKTGLDWTQAEIDALQIGYLTEAQDDGIGTVDLRVYHTSVLITMTPYVDFGADAVLSGLEEFGADAVLSGLEEFGADAVLLLQPQLTFGADATLVNVPDHLNMVLDLRSRVPVKRGLS